MIELYFYVDYATNVDITPVKELLSLQRRCVNNLTQIAKHSQTHNAYQDEIMEPQKDDAELRKQYSELLNPLAKLIIL